jgi:hypothetical protein
MSIFKRLFGGVGKELPAQPTQSLGALSQATDGTGRQQEVVDRIVSTMVARQSAQADGTFETSGKHIKSIVCSDNECPCTDQKPLTLGRDAYLYISPEVVAFRKDCLTLLELEIKVSRLTSPQDMLLAVNASMPKYICEIGAKRRDLDLSVALADGRAAGQTGFVPLRPTPTTRDNDLAKNSARRMEHDQTTQILVTDLLSSERSRREAALVAARQMANNGVRRAIDALETAIRQKAGCDSVEFHTPGLAVMSGEEMLKVRDTVLQIARRGTICREAKQVGRLISWLGLQGGDQVRTFLAEIRQVGGEEQVHQFQLVGTHLQAVAGYKMRRVS